MSRVITKCLLKCLLFGIATFWRGRECFTESIRVNESIAYGHTTVTCNSNLEGFAHDFAVVNPLALPGIV